MAVIISTIIEMILPSGTIKKYVRTVIGAYIVFVIISPIITKITGKQINLSSIKIPESEQYHQTAVLDTNEYIERTYIDKIKQDIIDNIKKKGYNVEHIEIKVETEEKNYGDINNITLKISKSNVNVQIIEPINIDISNVQEQKKETISTEELKNITNYLKETYGTDNVLVKE